MLKSQEILNSIRQMQDEVKNLQKEGKTDDALAKLNEIENAPFERTAGNLKKIKIAVITAICTGVAVSIATAVLKLTFCG